MTNDLAAIAAVGTGQRTTLPPAGAIGRYVPEPDHADPQATAYALLDEAAALAVARRGTPPTAETVRGEPAPDDTLPVAPAHVTALLGPLLADEGGMIRLSSDRKAVLEEALGLVAAAGMRLPHRLLRVAVARRDLREAVMPVLGERGVWLLGQLRAAGLDESAPVVSIDPDVWDTGTSAERLAWFRRLRVADPAAAREATEAVWKQSPAAFRTEIMTTIAATVTAADEPFCEQGLDDRAEGVRTAAAVALACLPGSAYVERMRARAAASVRVEVPAATALARLLKRSVERVVVITPPPDDAQSARDGLGEKVRHEQRIHRMVAAVPPSAWPSLTGLTAADLVTLPQEEPRWDVSDAIVAATVRNQDAIAATALVNAGFSHPALAPLLTADEAVAFLLRQKAPQVPGAIAALPRPWTSKVTGAVGRILLRDVLGPDTWSLFALSVPLPLARSWAERVRDDPRDPRAGREAAAVLSVRALIADALRPHLPPTAWLDQLGADDAPQEGRP